MATSAMCAMSDSTARWSRWGAPSSQGRRRLGGDWRRVGWYALLEEARSGSALDSTSSAVGGCGVGTLGEGGEVVGSSLLVDVGRSSTARAAPPRWSSGPLWLGGGARRLEQRWLAGWDTKAWARACVLRQSMCVLLGLVVALSMCAGVLGWDVTLAALVVR
jgi:hypothetical protein